MGDSSRGVGEGASSGWTRIDRNNNAGSSYSVRAEILSFSIRHRSASCSGVLRYSRVASAVVDNLKNDYIVL